MTPTELRERLKAAFPDAEPEVTDLTGSENHYQTRIVSSRFLGLARLQRHRLVHSALAAFMGGEIHALSMQLLTPEEARSESPPR